MTERRSPPPPDSEPSPSGDVVFGRAIKRTLIVVLLVGGVVALSTFVFESVLDISPSRLSESRAQSVSARWGGFRKCGFTERAAAAGIDFVHTNGAYGDKLLPETMGGGLLFGIMTTTRIKT